jgi:dipeptidyl aminopeptidase/acylaminoacyl peptidase
MLYFKLARIATGNRAAAALGSALLVLLAPIPALAQSRLAEGLTGQDLSAADPAVAASLPPYLESRAASFVDWLADGGMLVSTRFGETTQIHRLRSALSVREQLSFEPAGVLAASAQPAHETAFVYLSARDGGHHTVLSLEQPDLHRVAALTAGASRDGAAVWAHDGRRLAFSSDRIGGNERAVYSLDTSVSGTTPALIAGGEGYRWQVLDWSLDDQRLLLGRESVHPAGELGDGRPGEAELYLAELGSGQLTPLELPRRGAAKSPAAPLQARNARFAPDGRGVLLLSAVDDSQSASGAQFRQLRYFDPVNGALRVLSSESERDVELFDQSPDGRYIAYTIEEGASSQLLLIDTQRKLDIRVATLGPGLISSLKFDSTGKHLALTLESAIAPSDVYVLEPETQRVTRWTQSELGLLDPTRLVRPTLLHFPTWDRIDGQARTLDAFGYRAGSAPAGLAGQRPVVILLRSGGGSQFRPGFDPAVQFLVNELGFVVLAPEVRGSAGHGQAFEALGAGPLRDDAVRDIGSLLVWIGLQPELDRSRVFVMGEGYGSYLALAALGKYGDRLRGGIAAFLPHMGPLAVTASVRLPVLLVQGQGDPDAPAYESEQLAARLRASGAAVQYLAAADESGPFERQADRKAYANAVANFLASLIR